MQEPLQLYGEGDFALTDVKELDGTEEFLDLDVKVRKCQNEETILDCRSRKYLDMGTKKCGCIPHHLMSFDKMVREAIKKMSQKVKKSIIFLIP